jgi:hypothetical protein
MPKLPNPATQKWVGQYLGRYKGDFIQSWGIDLESQPGSLLSTLGLEVILNRSTINYGLATCFAYTDADGTARWWVGTKSPGTGIKPMLRYVTSAFIQDDSANTPTAEKDILDMTVHEKNANCDRLIVARTLTENTATLDILNRATANNAWTLNWWGTTLVQGRVLSANVRFAKLNRLLTIADKNFIHTIDSADFVTDSALTVDADYTIIGAQNTVDRLWYAYQGSKTTGTGRGAVVEWDGYSTTYNQLHKLDGIPVVGWVIRNIPYYVLDNGQIVKYNGLGFSNVDWATFPVKENKAYFNVSDFASNYCAYVENDIAYINMPTSTNSEKMRGGVWIFNEAEKSFYHGYKHRNTNQYGTSYSTVAGAIVNTFDAGKFMVGFGGVKDNQTTSVTDYVINKIGATSSYTSSYFVTPSIASNEIEDYFYNIWMKFAKLTGTNPKLIVKYRVSDGYATNGDQYLRVPLLKAITWKTATTFTVASVTDIAVGDEVEVLGGPNAGACFHISVIDTDTKTVTIDETPTFTTGVNYLGAAYFDNFIKISDNDSKNPITSTTKFFENLIVGTGESAVGPFIQFKIEIRGDNVQEIRQIVIDQKTHTQSNL